MTIALIAICIAVYANAIRVIHTDTSLDRVIYSGLYIPHLVNRSFTRLLKAQVEASLCVPCKICLNDYVIAEVS